MSLAARLAVLVLAAILPLVAALAIAQRGLYRDQEADVRAEALDQVRLLAGELSQLVDGIRQIQAVLVEMPAIRSGDAAGCAEILARVVDGNRLLNNLLVADRSGRLVCDGVHQPAAIAAYTVADRDYFREARRTGTFAAGTYAIGRTTGAPVVHYASPIEDDLGRFQGVVITALDLAALGARLDRERWSTGHATLVADREGTILLRHPDNEAHAGRRMPATLLALLDDSWPGTADITDTVDGVPRILGYVPPAANAANLYVGIGVSREEAYAILDRANLRGILVILLTGIVAAAAAWVVANSAVRRPVQRVLAAAERWRAGDLDARSGLEGRGEIAALGRTFDALAEDLQATLGRKEMLMRELAHRTMNNLQVLGSLMTLQRKNVVDETARRELDEAAGRVRAMAAAYRNLHRSDGGAGSLDFARLLEELCASVEGGLMPDGARCVVTAMPLVLDAETAMPIALAANELLTNAVKHGGTHDVAVILAPVGDGSWRLTIRNRGEPLPQGFSVRTARGFGLRMVAAMADQAGGALEIASEDGWTSFTVRFAPAAAREADTRGASDAAAQPAATVPSTS
ncbi:sensor histidine kinase [Salinarimonas rosea]|uniref:sensor histidine kinase n=1 Tax=Salinarimonas rosea TaxID=552063 RepID=UPI000427CB24|nr:cache domain-containing protein [Salinarimonas rosea]